MRRRIAAIEIDDAQEKFAFGREKLGDVIAGADFVVGVAGEVIAERVAAAAKRFEGAFGGLAFGGRRAHGGLLLIGIRVLANTGAGVIGDFVARQQGVKRFGNLVQGA